MWILYQILTAIALVVAAPFLLARRFDHYQKTLAGRLGRSSEASASHQLWVHAVSVGEVEVARTFLEALYQRGQELSTMLTTVTPTGQARARESMPPDVRVGYLPFELGFSQRAFLRRNDPQSLVLIEGELWPLLLHRLEKRSTPVVMINGRISDRSFKRLQRIKTSAPSLLRPLFQPVRHFGVQTVQDQQRLISLGVKPENISVTGNLKFDAPAPPPLPELESLIRGLAGGRPILVAGSTMPGEEAQILNALAQIEDLRPLLVLAPRHPERFGQVFQQCQQHFASAAETAHSDSAVKLRSQLQEGPLGTQVTRSESLSVLLLDTLGELAATYNWATAAFVGGTLVATGGHNPIEPARCGAPTCVGPSMENFHEIAQMFDRAEAWQRVGSATELGATWRSWIERPDLSQAVAHRALALIDENRGAVGRSVDLVLRFTGIGEPQIAGESMPAKSRSDKNTSAKSRDATSEIEP